MKTLLKLLLIGIAITFATRSEAKLNVVATTPDFAALAREVGGDKIEITTLARPTEDPHFVDAKPSFVVKLNRADVLLEGGAELESGWLPPLLEAARNPRIAAGAPGRIVCSQGIQLLEVPSVLDRSRGDIHAAGNPHYSIDPVNAKIICEHIMEAFSQLDSSNSAAYRADFIRLSQELDRRLVQWQKTLEPFRGQHIVAYHNSWPYFSQRFGVKVDLFLEPKPGLPPTPAHLIEVIAKMKEEKVRVIFVEPHLNRRTAETVARNTDAIVLDVSHFPGALKGTDAGYLQLVDHLVASLAKALASAK